MNIINYENVIFEGGGVKGIAYAKIPKLLEEYGILRNIKKIAGSSAGSIAALMLALKYNPIEIEKTIKNMNFNDFVDGEYMAFKILKILIKLGLNSGNHLVKWIKQLIMIKTGNPNTTFKELYELNKLELVITGTSLKSGKTEYFSYKTNPNMEIWIAVRISITIPIFFTPISYEDTYYLDGGLLSNFPIWIFDGDSYEYDPKDILYKKINKKTLGFKLTPDDLAPKINKNLPDFNHFHLIKFAVELIMLLINHIDSSYDSYDFWDRTVSIDVFDVNSTDFNLNADKVERLCENGYEGTKKFLNNRIRCSRLTSRRNSIH